MWSARDTPTRTNPNNVLENHLHRNKCPWKLSSPKQWPWKLHSGVIYRSKSQHVWNNIWTDSSVCSTCRDCLASHPNRKRQDPGCRQMNAHTSRTYSLQNDQKQLQYGSQHTASTEGEQLRWSILNKQTNRQQANKQSFVQASSQVNQTNAPLTITKPVNIFNPPNTIATVNSNM